MVSNVGAKQEIYALMRELSDEGHAIIMISSEMGELLGMSDRIIVMRSGRSVKELSKDEFFSGACFRIRPLESYSKGDAFMQDNIMKPKREAFSGI